VLHTVLANTGLTSGHIAAWIMHAGGRDVLAALQDRLRITADRLRYSADILRRYGNMSSAFVYFVLQAALQDDAKPGWWWMSSFGAGFSCHGAARGGVIWRDGHGYEIRAARGLLSCPRRRRAPRKLALFAPIRAMGVAIVSAMDRAPEPRRHLV
jgi:hypothetical protein